jgi:hypothetical protein
MKHWTIILACSAVVGLVGLSACGGDDPEGSGGSAGGDTGGSGGTAGTAGQAGNAGEAGSAGQGGGQTLASQNSAISDCGGFEAGNRGPVGYCDSEKLLWEYNPDTKTLALADSRVLLNCCGEHQFDVYLHPDTGVYEAWEIDSPEMLGGEPARCNCMCVFDFKTEVTDVRTDSIQLVLMRHVTDSGDPEQVWAGTLDFSTERSGELILDDQPLEYGCAEY